MNVPQLRTKRPKLPLLAAAVAVLLAGSAVAQDANRSPANESTQVARGETGMQNLEQHLESNTLRASKLVGMEVQSRSGDNLAEVRDIAHNPAPGQEMQLILALGGIVGDDQKLIAVPFDEIQINAQGDELYTSRTRDQLAASPTVTLDQRTTGDATASRDTASLNARRVGDLVGAEVIGSGGDAVGEVEDIILSTAGKDSVRAVLQVGGIAGIGAKRISLPMKQLAVERVGDKEPTLRVALDGDALQRMPEFKYEEQTAAL